MTSEADNAGPCTIRGSYSVDDMVRFAAESVPWEILVKPLDGKPFFNWKEYLCTPNITLYRERFESAIKVCGLSPSDSFVFSLPISRGTKLKYWDREEITHMFPVSLPDAADAVFDKGQEHLMVIIKLQFLKQVLTDETYDDLVKITANHWMSCADERLRSLATRLVNILDETAAHQEILASETAMRTLELELAETLSMVVGMQYQSRYRPRITQSRLGLKRALGLLLDENCGHRSIPDLCQEARISQRSLEYAFRDTLGMTPLAFQRLRRLYRAREALQSAGMSQTRVSEIALQSGFYELGRFSGYYREVFGELPSQTLRASRGTPETCRNPLLYHELAVTQ